MTTTIPIKNRTFGLPYIDHAGTVRVAAEWMPFWSTGQPPHEQNQGPCQMPEYKPLPASLDPRRVVEGDTAQCWFIRNKVMDAGVWQQVAVTEGKRHYFVVSLQAWCSNGNDPAVSDGEMYGTLGIDPNGGINPFETGVVWTGWKPLTAEHTIHESREVVAQADKITLFIRVWNKWRLSHNDAYADAACLYCVDDKPPPEPGQGVTEQRVIELIGQITPGLIKMHAPKVCGEKLLET